MGFPLNMSRLEMIQLLAEPMQRAIAPYSRSVRQGVLEPRLVELVRLRPATSFNCQH